MKRRDFLRQLGLGLAGAWAAGRLAWPLKAVAAEGAVPSGHLAFLGDAHLKDGDERRAEARALARAVGEVRRLTPVPDLVLFAGDLAHAGDSRALALGREILADLPAPVLLVMGEGDGQPDNAAAWKQLFGEPFSSQTIRKTENGKRQTVFQILGVHAGWCPGPGGPSFRLGASGCKWLARELERQDPEVPLIILSHAPLNPIYRPWAQWTEDGTEALARLRHFRKVLCLHGHTHNAGVREQGPGARRAGVRDQGLGFSMSSEFSEFSFTENRKPKTENCLITENGKLTTENCLLSLSLPATAWPGPSALQGTPANLAPGLGPAGCGWGWLAAGRHWLQFEPQIWQS